VIHTKIGYLVGAIIYGSLGLVLTFGCIFLIVAGSRGDPDERFAHIGISFIVVPLLMDFLALVFFLAYRRQQRIQQVTISANSISDILIMPLFVIIWLLLPAPDCYKSASVGRDFYHWRAKVITFA
jgi:hypothetical protein